jgi:hypothetical protein
MNENPPKSLGAWAAAPSSPKERVRARSSLPACRAERGELEAGRRRPGDGVLAGAEEQRLGGRDRRGQGEQGGLTLRGRVRQRFGERALEALERGQGRRVRGVLEGRAHAGFPRSPT